MGAMRAMGFGRDGGRGGGACSMLTNLVIESNLPHKADDGDD